MKSEIRTCFANPRVSSKIHLCSINEQHNIIFPVTHLQQPYFVSFEMVCVSFHIKSLLNLSRLWIENCSLPEERVALRCSFIR